MASITYAGEPVNTYGDLPVVGSQAIAFTLVNNNVADVTLADFAGKTLVLNIFPSIDTPTCARSTRTFNEALNNLKDTMVLCISADLPFANARFCSAEGLENVITLSSFRNPEFGKDYGVLMLDGPRRGLLSRAIVIIDKNGNVSYTEQVPEIKQDPDYDAVLKHVS